MSKPEQYETVELPHQPIDMALKAKEELAHELDSTGTGLDAPYCACCGFCSCNWEFCLGCDCDCEPEDDCGCFV